VTRFDEQTRGDTTAHGAMARPAPAPLRGHTPGVEALQQGAGNRAVARLVEGDQGERQLARLKYKNDWFDKALGGLIKDTALKATYGSDSDRRTIKKSTADVKRDESGTFSDVQDVTIKNGVHSLTGRHYKTRKKSGPFYGKTIIFLSGSGGTAEDYSLPVAKQYCYEGANMIAVNYRAFGGSTYQAKGKTKRAGRGDLSERSFLSDALAIFDWTWNNVEPNSKNIIVMGYSLGGPVASMLVDELLQGKVPIGGLIMHSALDSVRAEAVRSAGAYKGNVAADAVGNEMDSKARLRSIAQNDPTLPMMFISGSSADEHLDLNRTGLPGTAQGAGARNVFFGQGTGGHMDTALHFSDDVTKELHKFAGKV
jgi:pimeloyl-ACP methyl ester carboxylesterase